MRAGKLPWLVIYGPRSSRKSQLLVKVAQLGDAVLKDRRAAIVEIDFREGRWRNPMKPGVELMDRLLEKRPLKRRPEDLLLTLRALARHSVTEGLAGILVLLDHIEVLPNEGLRMLCRQFKQVREDESCNRLVGIVAVSSRSLDWIRDQGDSPFFGYRPIVVHAPRDFSIHVENDFVPSRFLTEHRNVSLEKMLLHMVTGQDIFELAKALLGTSSSFRESRNVFDEFEESGIFITNTDRVYRFRTDTIRDLVEAAIPLIGNPPSLPDFKDGSVAAILRSVAAYEKQLREAKELSDAYRVLKELWKLVVFPQEPALYIGLKPERGTTDLWLHCVNRHDAKLLQSAPPPVCKAAMSLSRVRSNARVTVSEDRFAVWASFGTGDSHVVVVTMGDRQDEGISNESHLCHFRNILQGASEHLTRLAMQEFGRLYLKDYGEEETGTVVTARSKENRHRVFVVHGRDLETKSEIENFLRRIDLKPIWWEEARRATRKTTASNLEIVQAGLKMAQAVLVLMTGDDQARLHDTLNHKRDVSEAKLERQSRPNVLIEAGMAMALYPKRTVLVEIGKLRSISDFEGLNMVEYDGSAKSQSVLATRLKDAGCMVQTDFYLSAPDPPERRRL